MSTEDRSPALPEQDRDRMLLGWAIQILEHDLASHTGQTRTSSVMLQRTQSVLGLLQRWYQDLDELSSEQRDSGRQLAISVLRDHGITSWAE